MYKFSRLGGLFLAVQFFISSCLMPSAFCQQVDLDLSATNLNIDAGSISIGANATGNGNGGFVSLGVDKYTSTSVISLSANGSGTGFGGEVDVYTYGADGDITVGGGAGQVQVSITGGSAGSESGDAGFAFFSAARNLMVDVDAINAVPLGDNGGGAWLSFESATSGTGSLSVSGAIAADGKGTGNGGRVTIVSNDPGEDITIGASTGIKLSATGGTTGSAAGNGGSINVISARNLTVNADGLDIRALGLIGDGGTISLMSGASGNGNLTINGTIAANAAGIGNGGTIEITSNGVFSSITLGGEVNEFGVEAEGGLNFGNGGSVKIISSGSINVEPGSINVNPSESGGKGGNIDITSSLGILRISADLIADGRGNSDGGTIKLTAGPGGIIGSGNDEIIFLSAKSGNDGGHGGQILLQSASSINIMAGIFADAVGEAGDGGTITLISLGNSAIISIPGSISATALGNGNGGSVSIDATGLLSSVVIGTSDLNTFISVKGGALDGDNKANGGIIQISAGGNITLNATAHASAGGGKSNGGIISLSAGISGEGMLLIHKDILANASGSGNGGTINLTYASSDILKLEHLISANAPSDGQSGHIQLSNHLNVPMLIELTGEIAADSLDGIASSFGIIHPNRVSINGKRTGLLSGPVNITAESLKIYGLVDNKKTKIIKAVATDGQVIISTPGVNSQVEILKNGLVSAPLGIRIETGTVTNSGTIISDDINGRVELVGAPNLAGPAYDPELVSPLVATKFTEFLSPINDTMLPVGTIASGTLTVIGKAGSKIVSGGMVLIAAGPEVSVFGINTFEAKIVFISGGPEVKIDGILNVSGISSNMPYPLQLETNCIKIGTTLPTQIKVDPAGPSTFAKPGIEMRADEVINNGDLVVPGKVSFVPTPSPLLLPPSPYSNIKVQGTGTIRALNIIASVPRGSFELEQSAIEAKIQYIVALGSVKIEVVNLSLDIGGQNDLLIEEIIVRADPGEPPLFPSQKLPYFTADQPGSGGIRSTVGNITLISHDGPITILEKSVVTAFFAGDILIHNSNTANGNITIGKETLISARSGVGSTGRVEISIGTLSNPIVKGTKPAPSQTGQLTVTPSNPSNIYFGSKPIELIGNSEAILGTSTGGIIFQSGGASQAKITLNDGVKIYSNDGLLSNLNLNDASTTTYLMGAQALELVGGVLTQAAQGVLGTITLTNISFVTSILDSLVIPDSVSLTIETDNPVLTVKDSSVTYIAGLLAGVNTAQAESPSIIINALGGIDITSTGSITANSDLEIHTPQLNIDGELRGASNVKLTSVASLNMSGSGLIAGQSVVVESPLQNAISGNLRFATPTQTLSADTVEISSAASIATSGQLTVRCNNFVNYGTLLADSPGASITIKSVENLTVGGQGILTVNNGIIAITTGSSGQTLTFNGSLVLNAGDTGSIVFNYDPILQRESISIVSFGAGSSVNAVSAQQITILATELRIEGNSGLYANSAASINWHSDSQSKHINITEGNSFTFSVNGGNFNFGQFSRSDLFFSTSGGTAPSIINFLGGSLTTYTAQGGSVIIDPGVIINTNNNITFNIHDGGTFINNGTIQSSANGGRIIVDAFAYPITLAGSGTTKFTGVGGAFFVLTAGLGSINVNISQNFDFSGNGGFVSFQAHTLNLMPGIQINALNGGAFEFIGNTLNMGAQSSINTTVTSGIAISINASNVLLPADSFATLSSLGGDIIATPRELAFTKAGGTETTLNLLGGKLITSSSVGPTLIDTGVTLASNNNISMQVFGSNQLILNGNITTSAPGASILITSSPIVTLTGAPASISATGGGNSTITIIGYDNGLNINSSYNLDAGSDGIVSLHAPDGVMTIASGVNVTINGGSQLVIATASLVMEANSKITVDKSTGTALAWGAEAHRSLKLSGPSGSSATIETTGGDIDIFGAGTGFPIAISKVPNSGDTTLNLNGGNVTLSALDTSLTIESGVTVASDKNLLVSLTGSTFNNQGTLSLSNGGSLSINADAQSTIVNMGAIAINGGNLNVSSASDIVINDTISMTGAGSLNISTLAGSNADIVINANIGGSASTNLNANGSGNIAQNSGVISGTSVNLTSGSGNIGSEGQNITTNATSLTANTTATGSVYITNNGSVDVGNSSAGETFQLTAVGNIKTLGIVSANNVVLQAAPGSGGSIFADPDIIGTTSITIRADGAGTITQLPGIRLVAPTVILESQDGGIGTSTTSIKTVADTLIVRTGTAASAYVSDMDSVALDTSSVGQTFRLRAKGDITVVGNVSANDVRLITTSPTGAIVVAATITGTSNVTLRTKDSGNVSIDQTSSVTTSNGSVLIRANDLKLDGTINAGTGQVTLRANGNRTMALADVADANGNDAIFDVNASELSKVTAGTLVIGDNQNTAGLVIQDDMNVSSTGAGNFDLTFRNGGNYTATSVSINLGDRSLDVNVGGSVSSGIVSANLGDIKLIGGNGITVAGALTTTGNVTLNTSTDGNGSITLQANVTSGGNLKLTAHGTGAITQTAGMLTANNLHLTTDNGNIGESNQPLNTSATKLFANTLGSVHINEFDDLVIGDSSAGGSFSVIAGGAITVNNVLTQNGSILVSAGAGTLTVGGQSVIFANEGNLHLQNRNTTSGAIVIGKDSILGANSASNISLGNIYITIGDIPSTPTAGTAPAKVTVINANGGQAYFDTTGINAQGAQSTVNVNGRTVLFETGGLGAGSIKLKGDVNISAGSPLEPIAFERITPMKKNAFHYPVRTSLPYVDFWCKKHTKLIEDSLGNPKLLFGEVLLAPIRSCKISINEHVIEISAGVICSVQITEHSLILRNLHENRRESISLNLGGKRVKVAVGEEIIVGDSKNAITKSLNYEPIGRRKVNTSKLGTLFLSTAEFSLISVMQNSNLLAKTINTNSDKEKDLRIKLMKMAACLMSLQANRFAYSLQPNKD